MNFDSAVSPYKFHQSEGPRVANLYSGFPWTLADVDDLVGGSAQLLPARDGSWLALDWAEDWSMWTVFTQGEAL